MRFGLHIPIAGGLQHAASLAEEAGEWRYQIFSGNPRSWKSSPPRKDAIETFAETLVALDIYPVVLHTPYLVNLASPDETLWQRSVEVVRQATELAQVYGAKYAVTHIGNHKGAGQEAGIARVAKALSTVLSEKRGEAMILLENGPGAGTEVGSLFEQLALILEAVDVGGHNVGICLDTARLWAA
ncbi:MAG: TIM barrel protein, partial [Chloroflexi bacterium]|nr:TIM barrel protein [Chloroflexota bacterium]